MRKSRGNEFVVVVSKVVEVKKDKNEKVETKGEERGNENVMVVSKLLRKKRKEKKVKGEEVKM